MSDRERFDQLIGAVLEHEGGLADDPDDPGGITKYGISLRSYPHLGRDGIRNLTVEQARDIYYRDWWQRLRCGEIQDDRIAQKLLDTCINVGAMTGVRILQRALCDVGQPVSIDGLIGPQTIGAANRADSVQLLAAMRYHQTMHYKRLIERNPKLAKFERGWMARANSR
jgi:lysozyme family protein